MGFQRIIAVRVWHAGGLGLRRRLIVRVVWEDMMKMKTPIQFAAVMTVLAVATSSAITVPFTDNFDDNSTGSEWVIVTDNPSQLSVAEVGGTVRVLATNSTVPTNDALYISSGADGFRMLTSANFELRIDYSFTSFQSSVDGGAFGLVFGIGRDLPDGTDSAAIGFGLTDFGAVIANGVTAQYRTDDVASSLSALPGSTTGTFLITYTASIDRLIMGTLGGYSVIYDGLVQGQWEAASVYVSYGGRGAGFVTAGSDAFFDNFQVVSGVAIPEPGSLGLVAGASALFGSVAFGRRRSGGRSSSAVTS